MTVEGGFLEKKGEGTSVLVGIRIDANSRELLNWALAKIAKPGDRVVAVHVFRPSEENFYKLSLEKSLDGYLAEYESFCNVKKVDLVGQISQGNSVRKVLVREAKICAATTVVVGISKHNALGCSLSMARYCSKRLPPTTTVLAVHNGKVIFQRDGIKQQSGQQGDQRTSLRSLLHPSFNTDCQFLIPSCTRKHDFGASKVSDVESPVHEIVCDSEGGFRDLKDNPVEHDSPLEEKGDLIKPTTMEIGSSELVEDDNFNLAHEEKVDISSSSISLFIRKLPESRPGWPLLRRAATSRSEALIDKKARNMSVVEWVMSLPNRSLYQTPEPQKGLDRVKFYTVLKIDLDKTEKALVRENYDCSHGRTRSCSTDLLELPKELMSLLVTNSSSCRWFSHKELQSLTDQFSPKNLIGKGGFGKVYKGSLPNGQPVAVKILKSSKDAWKDFLLEVDIITSLQHKNILPLIGVSVKDNELISIYPLLAKGSLEENLHCEGDKSVLPWEVRFKVAVGIAEALSYLHNDCSRLVIHRDVKSSNVLLSDEFEPQLSDFGLAIWAPTTSSYVTDSDVVGTFGYLAPEYFMYGKVSDKIDVYSYGVVLLELLSGRKPISNEKPKGQESLLMWATPILESGDPTNLLDPNLDGEFDKNQMKRMVLAASLCITRTARLRPRISQILRLLQGDDDVAKWAKFHDCVPKEMDNQDEEEYPSPNARSHNLSLALLEGDDDTTSVSSIEQNTHKSLEDYLRGRCSRSSSFD
ncbi:protein kinase STUNTED-like isoform X2 [Tasmannia lanceolata]|uniref:protein kinase STUNTED-like isoform X2 n=1 Tax=Tasmannia lanceolata TaxID=3420 RepID=UPI004063318E